MPIFFPWGAVHLHQPLHTRNDEKKGYESDEYRYRFVLYECKMIRMILFISYDDELYFKRFTDRAVHEKSTVKKDYASEESRFNFLSIEMQ